MKIIVIGGAGYIGGKTVDYLLDNGHEVIVYDNLTFESEYLKSGVEFIYGDVRDRDHLAFQLKGVDAVIHLAAQVGDGACVVNPEVTLEINRECVEWLANNYNGRILYCSTCSVYGAQNGILTEDNPPNPLSLYAISKYQSERYLKHKNALIYRLGTLFGLGDTYSRIRLDLVLNTLVMKAFFEKHIKVFGGEQYRPLLHVKDVAYQIAQTVNSNATGIFNLHYQNLRICDLAYQIRAHFNDVEIETVDIPFEDARNYRVSSDSARNYLNFKPIYTLDDGINELKKMFADNRIKNPYDLRYHNHNYLKNNPEYLDFKLTSDKKDLKMELEQMKLTSLS